MHGRDVAFGAWRSWVLGIALVSGPGLLAAQTGPGPFARIVLLRAREGMSAQFEAGYRRHLEWHRSNRDPWSWYGWSVVFGERVDWFMDGTFGHSAGSLDSAVAPAADGRDADTNVASYADFMSNGIYEFLPDVSNGSPEPPPSPLLELATYDLEPGAGPAFEQRLRTRKGDGSESHWFRLVAGGSIPRYLCLRPRQNLAVVASRVSLEALPPAGVAGVVRVTVEVLRFRPDLSLGVGAAGGRR